MEILIVFTLLVAAIVLFVSEWIPIELTTLLLLVILVFTGILTPADAFKGFSSDFIIILASIFVISGALKETGVLDQFGVLMVKLGKSSPRLVMLYIMVFSGTISAFMNNTTVTALFLSPVIEISGRVQTSASKLLIPLAFGSILGGTCTLIGTSTNVASSGYIAAAGYEPVGMFELLPMGIVLFLAGTIFMYVIGYGMLPHHSGKIFIEPYKLRSYVSDIQILKNSPLIGQMIHSNDLYKMNFQILKVIRQNESIYSYLTEYNKPYKLFRLFKWDRILPSREQVHFREGDKLVVEGKVEDLLKIKETEGIEISADTVPPDETPQKNLHFAEVIIPPGSRFIGQKVRKAKFRPRLGFTVIAINRHGDTVQEKIGDVEMQLGDILLIQGDLAAFDELRASAHLTLIQQFQPLLYKKTKGSIILFLFIVAIFLGSTNIIPLSVAFLTAAIGTVLIKALTPEKAYEYIEWELLILIGGMTAFGLAMEKTGAADLMASFVGEHLASGGELVVMAAFIIITIILTQAMSNAAAALVIIPVAIKTALEIGVDPRAFAIAVMIAASVSVMTPFEPSCIIVYGPGKYKFMDFLKTGTGVTILAFILMMILIPVIWPLK